MRSDQKSLFSLKSDACGTPGCLEKVCWQPIYLVYAECESNCGSPHFEQPAILISEKGYCETHKASQSLDTMLDPEMWEKVCGSFQAQGLKEPRKDWTAVSFHRIPDNVKPFTGPKLVTNPEPMPPVA